MRKLLPTAGFLMLGLLACAQPATRRELPQTVPQPVVIVPPHEAEARAWYWLGGKVGGEWQQVDAPSRYRIEFADARTLLRVGIEDAVEADELFSKLMGDKVEPRREFIERNALLVTDLDI